MYVWRQLVAIGVVLAILHLTIVDLARSAESAALPNNATVKQQVDQFGVGAKVKLRLANGTKLNGTIQAIGDDAFLVTSKESSPVSVTYTQVAQLKLAKNTYRSKGSVDQDEVRRIVTALGVGRHIMVKTTAGKKYHGNIQAIGAESFTMLPDRQTESVQITYNETLQTGPNLSKGAKIAIIVLAAVVVVAIIVGYSVGD